MDKVHTFVDILAYSGPFDKHTCEFADSIFTKVLHVCSQVFIHIHNFVTVVII